MKVIMYSSITQSRRYWLKQLKNMSLLLVGIGVAPLSALAK